MTLRNKIQQFNDWAAAKITSTVGSMWCAYAFTLLVVLPFYIPSLSVPIQYFSSAFLQLVLLPIIMVGGSVLSANAEKRAQEDHDTLMFELAEIKDMHKDLHDEITELKSMHSDVHRMLKDLHDPNVDFTEVSGK